MEGLIGVIIQLVSGAVGGNIAGALLKNLSLGAVGNSIAGIVGGGIGGQFLGMLGVGGAAAAGGLDVSGGVARTVLLELVGSLDDLGRGPLYHGGTQALLEEPEFEDPAMVRSLVGVLEDGLVLAGVLSDALRRHEVLVRIGAENREDALDHMSVVASTYDAAGAEGVVGLLGPTRMDYARAITTVRFVADELSDSLAGGDRDGA
jgi:uncharacterized membrane protein YeaQ/YmgE (transglycosylase-associated protein family)